MNTGFFKKQKLFVFHPFSIYRIPVKIENADKVFITTTSSHIQLNNTQLKKTAKKQYISFSVKENIDLNDVHYIKLQGNNPIENHTIAIQFYESDDFELNNNQIKKGNNHLELLKKKNNVLNDFKSYLINDNHDIFPVSYHIINERILIDFTIKEYDNYLLKIKNGIDDYYFQLNYIDNIPFFNKKGEVLNPSVKLSYHKNKLYAYIFNEYPVSEKKSIIFEGDLKKESFIEKGEKTAKFVFNKHVASVETFKFYINNNYFEKNVINKNNLPDKLIPVKNGFKFNKHIDDTFTIYINDNKYKINENFIEFNEKGLAEVYYRDNFLFSQYIEDKKKIPFFNISFYPLKAEITFPYKQDIEFKFKEINKIFNIPSGETKIYLNINSDVLTLEYIKNAFCYRNKWVINP